MVTAVILATEVPTGDFLVYLAFGLGIGLVTGLMMLAASALMFKYSDRFRGVQNSISVFGFFCVSLFFLALVSVNSFTTFPPQPSGAEWFVVICLGLVDLLTVTWCGLVLLKSVQDRA